jgi:hypothetical protein
MKQTLIIAMLFLFCATCTNKKGGEIVNKERNKYKNRCTLQFVGIKAFELDDETSYLTEYLQFIPGKSGEREDYFSFLNTYNNAIYFYDYKTGRFSHRIKYNKEGPDGVGDIQGYYYSNSDSVYIHAYWAFLIFLTDSEAKVKAKYKVDVDKLTIDAGMLYPTVYTQTGAPMKKYKNTIIATGFMAGEYEKETPTNRPVGVFYDVTTDKRSYAINYPEQYRQYNWGGGFMYRLPFYDLSGSGSMVVSFSADHYLTEYSLETGKEERHYAGSSAIKEIKSLDVPKSTLLVPAERQVEWYMTNSSYREVYYDKYKQRYYRIARLPVKDYVFGSNQRKPIVVIILDAQFNYLGEVSLPADKNLKPDNCFVSEDGLNIQSLTDDEDTFTFYQYNFLVDGK